MGAKAGNLDLTHRLPQKERRHMREEWGVQPQRGGHHGKCKPDYNL